MGKLVKVLVIDDEDVVRTNLRAFFEDMEYQVVEAANGQEGLEVFSVEHPDIVLTDLRMPGMDGLTFIAAMRKLNFDTPVIVVSGTGTLRDAIEAVRLGAWDYITKPVQESGELEIRIKKALERSRLLAENRRYHDHLEELVQQRTQQLRDSEERYRRLLSSVTNYVYTVTVKDGQPVSTRHRFGCEAVTGFTPGEYSADPTLWWHMVYEEDRQSISDMARSILTETTPLAIEHRIRHKDGTIRWVRNTLVPHLDKQGVLRSYDGIIADITERKRAEEKIRTLNAELEQRVVERTSELQQANRQLEMFTYSVSHDLRAPLRNIIGFSRILQDECSGSLEPAGQGYLGRILNGCQRMDELIEDLLSLSRFSRQELRRVTVDTGNLVREVLTELGNEQQERTIDISIGDLPLCSADPMLLHQVYVNLLGNALKYTRKRETARIEIGSKVQDDATVYFVKDNGAGFDMQYAEKLFGVFQRFHRAEDFEGTGVGLAIVQNIVQRHGGKIWAEAAVDRGAAFYFTLD